MNVGNAHAHALVLGDQNFLHFVTVQDTIQNLLNHDIEDVHDVVKTMEIEANAMDEANQAVSFDIKDDKDNGVKVKSDFIENAKKAIIYVAHENEHDNTNNEKKHDCTLAKNGKSGLKHSFLDDDHAYDGNKSGTKEEQSTSIKELENFFKEKSMEFKPPKFYGEGLNCLKLWRVVMRLGDYDKLTSCKLWSRWESLSNHKRPVLQFHRHFEVSMRRHFLIMRRNKFFK